MAFNNIMQLATAHISKQLPQGATVVEWGNQRFRYSEGWIDECEKISGRAHRRPTNFVWEYFEDLGFSDYLAIDINTELRAIAMDLNFILKDKYNYTTQFDYVTNNGTGEHIFDQRTVFENMHNLCKPGGIMINVLPFAPWFNHCFYSFHPGLFRDIAAANGYEWQFMWLAQNTGKYIDCPTGMDSWTHYEQKKPRAPVSELERAYDELHARDGKAQNVSIVTAYRKINDKPFQIPFQGRYVNDVVDELKTEYSETNIDVRQADHRSANY
jgi:SAM-dependent methyltransferase